MLAALVQADAGHLYTIEGEPARRIQALRAIEAVFPEGQRVTSIEGLFDEQLPELLEELHGPVDFVFEDGTHIPEMTLSVFGELCPRMRAGGLMIFDDIRHPNGNYSAWTTIKQHEAVEASVEINGRLGICVL